MLSKTTVTLQHSQRERYYGKKMDAYYYKKIYGTRFNRMQIYLNTKCIQAIGDKLILTLEYNQNNNFVVYHQNIKGLSDKIDQLLIFVKNTFCSVFIVALNTISRHQSTECCPVQQELKFSLTFIS